jgi:hypothetical protein
MGLAALDAVMLRSRAAPLLLSLSLAGVEGMKERREETCTRACIGKDKILYIYMYTITQRTCVHCCPEQRIGLVCKVYK